MIIMEKYPAPAESGGESAAGIATGIAGIGRKMCKSAA